MSIFKRKPKIHVICKNLAGYTEKSEVFDSLHGKYVKDHGGNRYYLAPNGEFKVGSATPPFGYRLVLWMMDKDHIELQ